ncbi:hypothetical protein ACLB2K_061301 [Fragaria x ananassa]
MYEPSSLGDKLSLEIGYMSLRNCLLGKQEVTVESRIHLISKAQILEQSSAHKKHVEWNSPKQDSPQAQDKTSSCIISSLHWFLLGSLC